MTRWGILATGGIAATVAGDLAAVPGAELLAVASRDDAKAAAFAAEHGVARSYGRYADLLADPDVDVVYVATPHGLHHEVAGAALRAGKPVLVEKAFTTTLADARDLVATARERDLFCMEAMWTRFQPNVVEVLGLLDDGVVGDVRHVAADLGFRVPPEISTRFLEPALGGGALLDMGIYPVALAHMVLGPPTEVVARGSLTETGVDAEATLLLSYASGATAALHTTMVGAPPRRAALVGTHGHVRTEGALHVPDALVVERPDVEPLRVEHPRRGRGYGPMLEHVQQCLAEGRTESPVWPLSATLAVMAVLEDALHQLGVHMEDAVPRG